MYQNKEKLMYKQISYFKSLNSLRFFAALLVLFHHSETMKIKYHLFNLNEFSFFNNGNNAVLFFFVLSGFLITYLLLKEDNKNKTINVKRFYLKRVLRIWPIYFLLIILGTICLPLILNKFSPHLYEFPYSFNQSWYYFFFFFPCLVLYHFGHHILEPLWSIGVEEIFYLIWAPLFKFLRKYIHIILYLVIILKIIAMIVVRVCLSADNEIAYLINTYSFEAMAIGGLGAYWLFNIKNKKISDLFIFKKWIQLIVYAVVLIYLFFNNNIHNTIYDIIFKTPILSFILLEFLYLYIIIASSCAENSIIHIENKILSYLGDISYGVYMYHIWVISFVVIILKKYLILFSPFVSTTIFYLLVISGTIIISAISKRYFENLFTKNLYSKIVKK